MKEKYYITTAIVYTSQKPHIGNLYEIVLTDCIARYKRQRGYDVFFLTGTDEHGLKIQNYAEKAGVSPQTYVDGITKEIKELYRMFDISYDGFIRTTDKKHELAVQKIFKRLYDNGDIYKGTYEGMYCTPCESFWTSAQLKDGCCPDCGGKVMPAKEEAYFLRLSKYQDRLIEYIETHDDFIIPEARKNEMLNNFLRPGLQDLCVSRSTFKWGIPVSFDDKHVIYVWMDALSNYITAIGYDVDHPSEQYKKLWPADMHVIGKDIVRFHTIYWPIILMALGEPLPKHVLGHPWLLFGEDKMSKSKGNVLYGDKLVEQFGLDPIRYYLLSELPLRNDGSITYESLIKRCNTDLANIYGNLVSRTAAMITKYFDGRIPSPDKTDARDDALKADAAEYAKRFTEAMDSYRVADAASEIMSFLKSCNKYIDDTTPWVLARSEENRGRLATVMANLVEGIRQACVALTSFMPQSSAKAASVFAFDEKALDYNTFGEFGYFATGNTVSERGALFARIDEKAFYEKLNAEKEALAKAEKSKKQEKKNGGTAPAETISIDDFAKINLVACKVLKCEAVPKSDKLLKLFVDDGKGGRQVVSGIARFYTPDELIGKTLVLVENLKAAKLMGLESRGMILASGDKEIKVVELSPDVAPGTRIG